MSINRYNRRRDANEKEIIDVFEVAGISVVRLDTPLDLLLGFNERNYLVEVKMSGRKLNSNQIDFINKWKGQFFVCFNVNQARLFAKKIINN